MANDLTLIVVSSIVSACITYIVSDRTRHRTRLDTLSQIVFTKRLEACEALFSAMMELKDSMIRWIQSKSDGLAKPAATSFAKDACLRKSLSFVESTNRYSLHLDRATGVELFCIARWAAILGMDPDHPNFSHYARVFFNHCRTAQNLLRDRSGLAKFHVEFDSVLDPGARAQSGATRVQPEVDELVADERSMIDAAAASREEDHDH